MLRRLGRLGTADSGILIRDSACRDGRFSVERSTGAAARGQRRRLRARAEAPAHVDTGWHTAQEPVDHGPRGRARAGPRTAPLAAGLGAKRGARLAARAGRGPSPCCRGTARRSSPCLGSSSTNRGTGNTGSEETGQRHRATSASAYASRRPASRRSSGRNGRIRPAAARPARFWPGWLWTRRLWSGRIWRPGSVGPNVWRSRPWWLNTPRSLVATRCRWL